MVYAPIWKDTYYSTTADSITYSIKTGSQQTIFNGKAVKCPGAANVEINVSLICRNFMNNDLPDFRGVSAATTYWNDDACKVFQLYQGSTLLETYKFLWDWSYQDWNGGSQSMSSPINGHYNGSMIVFSSSVSSGGYVGNVVSFPGGNYCGTMALYYQGAAGGWNSFLIEGNVKRTDKLTRYNISRRVKNTSIDFENTTYSMDVDPTYEVYTGWLTDAQADNLAENLLKSPRVYAHDLVTGAIFPVVITDVSIQHKTYKTNSHKPVNYVISLKASQTKIRR